MPPPGQREYPCAHLLPGHRADPRQAPVEPVAEWLPGPCLTTRDSGPCKSLSWGALGLGAGGGGPRPFHLRPRRGSESGLLATTVRMLMASKAPPWAPLRPPPQVSSGLRPLCSQGPLAPGHCQTAGVQTDMGTRTPAGQTHACTLKEVHTQTPAPLAPLDQGVLPANSCGPMEAELRAVATGPQSHLPGGNGGETQAVQHVPTRAWRLSRVLL